MNTKKLFVLSLVAVTTLSTAELFTPRAEAAPLNSSLISSTTQNLFSTKLNEKSDVELAQISKTANWSILNLGQFVGNNLSANKYITPDTTLIAIQSYYTGLGISIVETGTNKTISTAYQSISSINFKIARGSLVGGKTYQLKVVGAATSIVGTFSVEKVHAKPTIHAENSQITQGDTFDYLKGVTAFDDEGTDITNRITYVGKVLSNVPGEYPVTYNVTDKNQLSTNRMVIVTVVKKNVKPTLIANDRTIKENEKFDYMEGVSAKDQDGNDLTSSITHSGVVNTAVAGTYKVEYNVTDKNQLSASKTITVTVEKVHTKPTIYAENSQITQGDTFDYLKGVTAFDDEGTNITNRITYTGNVHSDVPGTYSVTYSVLDKNGLSNEKTIIVTVKKAHTKPTIHAENSQITQGDAFDYLKGVTAFDDEGTNITNRITYVGNVLSDVPGAYPVTYSVLDKNGLSNEKTIIVTVVRKNVKPTLIANDRTVKVNETFDYMEGVSAKDQDGNDLTSAITYSGVVNTTVAGTYKVEYKVTDKNQLSDSKSITVTVEKEDVVIAKPTLNSVLSTDSVVTGTGTPGLSIHLKIGDEAYIETVQADGKFSIKLDHSFPAGTAIESWQEDEVTGTISEKVFASVEKNELKAPVLDKVTDADLKISGTASPGTLVHITIGVDKYQEYANDQGIFSTNIDQTYVAGTAIYSFAEDEATGIVSSTVHDVVVNANDQGKISINQILSSDTFVSGKTAANSQVDIIVDNSNNPTRARVFTGNSDANGNYNISMNNNSYVAGTKVTVKVYLPGGNPKKDTIIIPKIPVIYSVSASQGTIAGNVDANAKVFVEYDGKTYQETADKMGEFKFTLPELTANETFVIYQESHNLTSEKLPVLISSL